MVLWEGSRSIWTQFLSSASPYGAIFQKLLKMCTLEDCDISDNASSSAGELPTRKHVQTCLLRMVDRLLTFIWRNTDDDAARCEHISASVYYVSLSVSS
jgi:hypothetical protein